MLEASLNHSPLVFEWNILISVIVVSVHDEQMFMF